MKSKIVVPILITLLISLACQFSEQPSVSDNNVPTQTQEIILQPTVTPYPVEISDAEGVSMSLVPAGEFSMGSDANARLAQCQKYRNDCELDWFTNEEPPHQIYLDTFYMDKYEVTNALYKACVDASVCTPPTSSASDSHSSYYDNPTFDNYPVISVDWKMAKTYCEWRGAYLPTEAQWEKAARGTDARTYPWGEEIDCSKGNFYGCQNDTTAVGSYENGVSPYGLYDMAGNVWEWVADYYSASYYQNSPLSNPLGPETGEQRGVRGGSWNYVYLNAISASRISSDPTDSALSLGFRCAYTPLQQTAGISPTEIVVQSSPSAVSEPVNVEDIPMVLIPDGEFRMGLENNDKPAFGPPPGQGDELPAHTVYLDAFYIDKYEVTNVLYKACVDDSSCLPPQKTNSQSRPNYYGNPEFDDYPVIFVDWEMAMKFCTWRGARLPTEAEWEKVASTTSQIDCDVANYDQCFLNDTTPVGSYENVNNDYGVYDITGNVAEWVADWYQDDYYETLGDYVVNPMGPDDGEERVIRGGSWYSIINSVFPTFRGRSLPSNANDKIGFRCTDTP